LICPDGLSEIFLQKRLDRLLVICPSGSQGRLKQRLRVESKNGPTPPAVSNDVCCNGQS
jgi:hypothetical protein